MGIGEASTFPPLAALDADDGACPALDALMGRFRSLGDNCELGLVQRRAGAEPIDLLRFAGLHLAVEQRLHAVTAALERGFDGLGEPGSLSYGLGDADASGRREFYIQEDIYHLRYHTNRYTGQIEPERLIEQQSQLLRYWRQKLLEDLQAAQKVCVWKSNIATRDADVWALLAAIRRYGRNDLLWLTTCDEDHDVGAIEDLGGGLFRGYVSRFAPYDNAGDFDLRAWLMVCARACQVIPTLRQTRLRAMAGLDDAADAYDGAIDGLIDSRLSGWCVRRGDPQPVWLQLFVDGRLMAVFPADEPRGDLEQLGLGSNHAFHSPIGLRGLPAGAIIRVKVLGAAIDVPHSGHALAQYRTLGGANDNPADPVGQDTADCPHATGARAVPAALRDGFADVQGSAARIAREILALPPERRDLAIRKTYAVFLAVAVARGCSERVAADFAQLMRGAVRNATLTPRETHSGTG